MGCRKITLMGEGGQLYKKCHYKKKYLLKEKNVLFNLYAKFKMICSQIIRS